MRLVLAALLGVLCLICPAFAQTAKSASPETSLLWAWIPAFGGVATLIVCGIVFFYTRFFSHVKTTIDLHSEFHSESFTKSRIAAADTLDRYINETRLKTINLESLRSYCASLEKDNTWPDISRVLHFFERLAILRQHRLVNKKTSAALFDRYVEYWRRHYFAKLEEDERWKALVRVLKADKPNTLWSLLLS